MRGECYGECSKGLWSSKMIVESTLHREVALMLGMRAHSVILALRRMRGENYKYQARLHCIE